MKFFLGRKSTSFCTQRIVAKDIDLRPSATKVLISSEKSLVAFLQQVLFEKKQKQIVQESVDCDVILDPKQTKVFVMW